MPAPEDKKDPVKPSGQVRHDSTGRAVWEWAVDSGRHAIESTSRLLKRLDMPGLTLADDHKKDEDADTDASREGSVPTFGGKRETDPKANIRRSYDPYDNRAPLKRTAPAPKAPPKPRITQPAPETKPGLLGRIFGRK